MIRAVLALAEGSIRRPWLAILLLALLTLLAAPGLLRLQIQTDGRALVPPEDPVLVFDAELREHFQLYDPILVFLETSRPEGIYHLSIFESIVRLTEELEALRPHGVRDVMSLANEHRDRVYPGTLNFRPYLDPLPDTEERMEMLRSDIDAADIMTGTLVTADRRATAIVVGVAAPEEEAVDRADLYRRVAALAGAHETETETLVVVGAPAAEALLGDHLIADLALLVPLALLVIGGVLWLGCRRLWGVLLGFMEVGACLVFTFGLMGWLGVPVYLTTAVLPVVLTTVGLADEIHIFWEYQRRLAAGGQSSGRAARVMATLRAMGPPVTLTSITTTLGFLSFLASSIPPVRTFGLFAAVGVTFCWLFSMTAVPACLRLLPEAGLRHPRPGRASWSFAAAAWMGRLASRGWATLAVLGLVTLVAALGVGRLVVQDSWIDGFAAGSPFRVATERVNGALHGTHVLQVHLGLEPDTEAGDLTRPALLEAIGGFEAFLRERPEVGGVLGPHSHLLSVAYLWLARNEERRRIPANPEGVEMLLGRFDDGRGELRRRQVIDDDRLRSVVTLFMEEANFRETAVLMQAIEAYVSRELAPLGFRMGFAGDVAVSQAMIPRIVRTQVSSLLLAVLGALLCLALLLRSLRWALLAVAPIAAAILWIFGLMGWLGIPLGVATSMFCAITLGVGVDYAIHYLARYRRAREQGDAAPALAAVESAGPAILADTAAVALGFGLLVASQVPANARLGLLVAAALAASSLLTLGGLGAWLARRPAAARAGVLPGSPDFESETAL